MKLTNTERFAIRIYRHLKAAGANETDARRWVDQFLELIEN